MCEVNVFAQYVTKTELSTSFLFNVEVLDWHLE